MFLSIFLVRFLLSCLVLVNGATAMAVQTRATKLYDCVHKALIGNNTEGRIVRPSDSTYTNARATDIEHNEFPVLIAYATQVAEVTPLVHCAQQNGIRAIPRSGGHHFESWSSLNGTLVIDLGHVDSVTISADRNSAVVGPGARLGTLYTKLSKYERTFIGGICPTVAIGGYLGVGGYSQQMRAMGMAADQVLSAQVVLANGTTVTANQEINPELFFAIRGGGMYGIIVEITLKVVNLPRSANFVIDFPGRATRFQSAKTWMHWAPTTPPVFNGQINVYNNRTQVTGWCLGCTQDYLQRLLDQSGLLKIPGVQPHVSGNCSTDNSRLWAEGHVTSCLPDEEVGPIFANAYNVIQDPFTPVPGYPNFQFDEVPADPNYPPAELWSRFDMWDKDYFERKSRPLTDSELQYIIDKSGKTPDSADFWLEWTLFDVTAPPPTTSAYAWQSEARSLLRFEIAKSYPQSEDFITDLDKFLNPRIGGASYSGYMDSRISSNPWTTYWGSNVDVNMSPADSSTTNKMSYTRVATVTGANRGIGLAIVRNLALQYPKSSFNNGPLLVYLTARDRSKGEEAIKLLRNDSQLKRADALSEAGVLTTIKYHQLDISDKKSIDDFASFLEKEHPDGIDFAINNAGIAMNGFDANVVNETLHSNYYGTLEATERFLPLIRDGGRLVNVSSMSGNLNQYSDNLRRSFLNAKTVPEITALMEQFTKAVESGDEKKQGWPSAAYAVSKAGVTGMTKAVALQEQQKGSKTLINACCPGWVVTDMTKGKGTKTPDQGAQTPVLLALGDIEEQTGLFWQHEKPIEW